MRTSFLRLLGFALALSASPLLASQVDRRLDIYWIDVEGGSATLVVTPAGESVLIDAGSPGTIPGQTGRDAERILKVAREVAGLSKIDAIVVTHFHPDHFGGVAEVARGIPVGTLYENPTDGLSAADPSLAYLEAPVRRRRTLEPGLQIPLAGLVRTAYPRLHVAGTRGRFVPDGAPRANEAICAEATRKADDTSGNADSAALVLRFGAFDYFVGGDLTWNTEERLACPQSLTGPVDVMQTDHHGFDDANNPVLLRTLDPSVVVFANGARKGLGPGTVATVRSLPSIKAIYQLHRGLGENAVNTQPLRIANAEESCAGAYIKLSVRSDGTSYEITVPSTKSKSTFQVRKR